MVACKVRRLSIQTSVRCGHVVPSGYSISFTAQTRRTLQLVNVQYFVKTRCVLRFDVLPWSALDFTLQIHITVFSESNLEKFDHTFDHNPASHCPQLGLKQAAGVT